MKKIAARLIGCAIPLSIFLSAVSPIVEALPPQYKVKIIGRVGFNYSDGRELNNAGDVMGDLCTDECSHTFRYRYKDGSLIDIETEKTYVWGWAMNGAGDIAGTFEDPDSSGLFTFFDNVFASVPPLGDFVPYTVTDLNNARQMLVSGYFDGVTGSQSVILQNDVITAIPLGSFADLSAVAINNAGMVTGSAGLSTENHDHLFLYSDSETRDLGSVPNAEALHALDLSGSGLVMGEARMIDGSTHAIRSIDGVLVDLGTLGGATSIPNAINNAGIVVGAADLANGERRAFLHDGKTMRNLGASGGAFSAAYDVTDNGQVVGYQIDSDNAQHAFIYYFETNKKFDVSSLISDADPLRTKVEILGASKVNEFGQILAWGNDLRVAPRRNSYRNFLLTPIDSTPPTIKARLGGTKRNNGWYTTDVALAWSVADAQAPVGRQTGCDPRTVTADTAGTRFTCTARSIGGTARKSVTIKRDTTRPEVSISSPAAGAVYTRNQVVTAIFGCADAPAGIRSCVGSVGNGLPIDTSMAVSNAVFSVKATDKAGRTRTVTHTYSIN